MHNLLVQLGSDIVREQSIHDPGQRRFLVDRREICEVLTGDTTGSKSVIGINFEHSMLGKELDICERAFEGMSNIQFLKFDGYRNTLKLPRGLNYIPHKLRLLFWSRFPMTCLPCDVSLKFLVEVKMNQSKLEKLWEGIKPLGNLKWMDLSLCFNLK